MSERDQQARAPSGSGHGWFDIATDQTARRLRAVCECGWTSPPSHAAGLAGAAWDLHVSGVTGGPDGAVIAELEASLDRGETAPELGERSNSDQ